MTSGFFDFYNRLNKALGKEIDATADKLFQTTPLDEAETSRVLAKYVADIVEKGLANVKDNGGDIQAQVALANRLVNVITNEIKETCFDAFTADERAEQLLALFDKKNSAFVIDERAAIVRPETCLT